MNDCETIQKQIALLLNLYKCYPIIWAEFYNHTSTGLGFHSNKMSQDKLPIT